MGLTVKCGVVKLTKRKRDALNSEYENLQRFLQGEKNVPLYSATRQQAQRYYKRPKTGKEYPISLRKDLLDLYKSKAFWFLRIRVQAVRGGLKIPIIPHRMFPENAELCESKLFRKDEKFFVNLYFKFNAAPFRKSRSVIGVDLGERVMATTVLLQNGCIKQPKFLGREVRGIRRHHAWLRRRFQKRGLKRLIKRIGNREKQRVDAVLHRISKQIVDMAKKTDSLIAIGDLIGIRRGIRKKGKRLRKFITSMPFRKLTRMITYKAMLIGVPVMKVNEAYTSISCHVCGSRGSRLTQGRFLCSSCGEYNADLNAAINIARKIERHLGYMPLSGAVSEPALNCATA